MSALFTGAGLILIAGWWLLSDVGRDAESQLASGDRMHDEAPRLRGVVDANVQQGEARDLPISADVVPALEAIREGGSNRSQQSTRASYDSREESALTQEAEPQSSDDQVSESSPEAFHLSASIEQSCAEYPDACKDEKNLLAAMDKEPRDEAWADRTEKSLLESVLAHPGEVRAIECRSTLCAIEVASQPPTYHGPQPNAAALGLSEIATAYAYERKAGQLTNVTLRIWRRE